MMNGTNNSDADSEINDQNHNIEENPSISYGLESDVLIGGMLQEVLSNSSMDKQSEGLNEEIFIKTNGMPLEDTYLKNLMNQVFKLTDDRGYDQLKLDQLKGIANDLITNIKQDSPKELYGIMKNINFYLHNKMQNEFFSDIANKLTQKIDKNSSKELYEVLGWVVVYTSMGSEEFSITKLFSDIADKLIPQIDKDVPKELYDIMFTIMRVNTKYNKDSFMILDILIKEIDNLSEKQFGELVLFINNTELKQFQNHIDCLIDKINQNEQADLNKKHFDMIKYLIDYWGKNNKTKIYTDRFTYLFEKLSVSNIIDKNHVQQLFVLLIPRMHINNDYIILVNLLEILVPKIENNLLNKSFAEMTYALFRKVLNSTSDQRDTNCLKKICNKILHNKVTIFENLNNNVIIYTYIIDSVLEFCSNNNSGLFDENLINELNLFKTDRDALFN